MKKTRICYSCGSRELSLVLDLGRLPQTAWLSRDQLAIPEQRYLLEAFFCRKCSLLQLADIAEHDPTVPGAPPSSFQRLMQDYASGPEKLWINLEPIHSKTFTSAGIPVIEVSETGSPPSYRHSLKQLAHQGIQADVIYLGQQINRLYDPNGLLEAVAELLLEQGVVVLESPYIRLLAQQRRFTAFSNIAIYSFSVRAMQDLLRRHGLWLNRIEAFNGHLRFYGAKAKATDTLVASYLEEERRLGLDKVAYYQEFAAQVAGLREGLLAILLELRSKGKHIAAYGVSEEMALLLNYVGLGHELVSYLVDPKAEKYGRFVAGVHVPIYGPNKLSEEPPDYLLMLEDSQQQALEAYFQQGGKLLLVFPSLEIVNPVSAVVHLGAS